MAGLQILLWTGQYESEIQNTMAINPQTVSSGKSSNLYAFLVAFVAAIGGFLFGYDLVIISGAQIYLKEQFALSDAQFGFAITSAILGCIVGPLTGVWFCDKIGRKNTMLLSCVLFGVSAVITGLARDMTTFNVFRFVGGLGVGLCSIASPLYIAEVAPARMRGALGVMYQLAIAVGALTSSFVAFLLAKNLHETVSWRWMFISEMAAVFVFFFFLLVVPKSPRWLAEKGRFEEAFQVLTKVENSEYAGNEMKGIKEQLAEETGTFSELFEPGIRRALLVGICLAIFNNTTGWSAMAYYLPTLFKQGGFPETVDAIYRFALVNGWQVILTFVSIFLVDRFGRRPLWLFGSASMIVFLTLTGLVFQFNLEGPFVLTVVFLCAVSHATSLGPLPWFMMSELYPTRCRARAVAITTTVLWVAGWGAPFAFPIISGASESLIGSIGGAFWLFALICVASLIFGLKWLPETKGRTLEEIAKSWTKG